MLQKPKFVYFDIGSVFFTTEKAFTTVSGDVGVPLDSMKDLFNKYGNDLVLGNITVSDFWQICCTQLHISRPEYNLSHGWVYDYTPIISMHQLASEISSVYKVGILSNQFLNLFPEMYLQSKIPNIKFDPLINSADVKCMKPEPAIYQIAEDRCGFKGADIMFVDDRQENLATATTFGWQTFLFDYKNPQKSCDKLAKILL
jgi:FMN phosphatase YigB (HAD superfamily)